MFIYINTGEEWKPCIIDGIETHYCVSSYGRVKNMKSGKILKPRPHTSGYLQVSLYYNDKEYRYYIHRLVLQTYNPIKNSDKFQVNHINGNKKYNYVGNLEWCNNSENQLHAIKLGLKKIKYGEDVGRSKYTNDEIENICKLLSQGYSTDYIMSTVNIYDRDLISDIRNGRRWQTISNKYCFTSGVLIGENNPSAKYNNSDAIIVCTMLESGNRIVDIHNKTGYSKDFISKIKRRKNWKHISDKYNF